MRERRRRPARLALVGAVLGAATWAVVAAAGDDPYPDHWDPRVAPLAHFVEQQRGLSFDHPVAVDFLDAADYSRLARQAEPDDEGRAQLDRAVRVQRALGLLEGDVDLFGAVNDVVDAGTLAFYDPAVRRVRVRGSALSPARRVTVVHELTHALADQALDLGRIDAETGDGDDGGGAATGLRALAEGDALAVENAYVEGLDEAERDRYRSETARALAGADEDLGEVPAVVKAVFAAPYDLGAPLVTGLVGAGGNDLVDRAYRSPPANEAELFEPSRYLDRLLAGDDAEDPPEVRLRARGSVEDGALGAFTWYLLLVERIDPALALAAADGWAGDRYVVTDDDGTTCVRAAFVGATRSDEAEMGRALAAWARAMPGRRARAERVEEHPALRSCDPGPRADLALTGRSERAMTVPAVRAALEAEAVGPAGVDVARCYGQRVIDAFDFDRLTDPSGALFADPAFARAATDAAGACA